MTTETTRFPLVIDPEPGGADPPYDYEDYIGTRLRHRKTGAANAHDPALSRRVVR